jgi:5-methylcytosine-specific restriction protein A
MSSDISWRDGQSSAQRGYGHKWREAREGYLRLHPLCVMCKAMGRTIIATVVDHKVPHRGDMKVFWDSSNWQPLCATCHSSHKQRLERSGRMVGCGVDGLPLDPGHHWRRGGDRTA